MKIIAVIISIVHCFSSISSCLLCILLLQSITFRVHTNLYDSVAIYTFFTMLSRFFVVPSLTATFKASRCVYADRILLTIMSSNGAFIQIYVIKLTEMSSTDPVNTG
jgi:hypothetical protein